MAQYPFIYYTREFHYKSLLPTGLSLLENWTFFYQSINKVITVTQPLFKIANTNRRTFTKQQLGTSNVRTKSPVEILQIITLGVPATFPVLEQAATKSSQTLTQLMACLAGIVRIKLQSGSVQTRRSRSKHPDTMRFGVVSKSETRKREILISI